MKILLSCYKLSAKTTLNKYIPKVYTFNFIHRKTEKKLFLFQFPKKKLHRNFFCKQSQFLPFRKLKIKGASICVLFEYSHIFSGNFFFPCHYSFNFLYFFLFGGVNWIFKQLHNIIIFSKKAWNTRKCIHYASYLGYGMHLNSFYACLNRDILQFYGNLFSCFSI